MFDKITARVRKLCYGLNELVDPVKVAMRVIEGLYDGVTTSELDNLAAEIASQRSAERIRAVGVETTARVYEGASHSFLEAVSAADIAERAHRESAEWLMRTLGPGR